MARREFSRAGWLLTAYYALITLCVWGADLLGLQTGWGYLLAVGLGIGLMLCATKPSLWQREILPARRRMSFWRLMALIAALHGIQLVFMAVANLLGYAKLMLAAVDHGPGMYIYVCLLAPVMEELLFRGVLLRCALPYGKGFAILATAAVFGIYHASLTQSPFAFALGCVLGYAAVEYSLIWSIFLHIFNNLVISDWLPRLGQWLLGDLGNLLVLGTVVLFGIVTLVVLIRRQDAIADYFRRNKGSAGGWRAILTAPGMWALALTLIAFFVWNTIKSRLF